jgi:ubiquitin carboxyl-terminal hydrolase 8
MPNNMNNNKHILQHRQLMQRNHNIPFYRQNLKPELTIKKPDGIIGLANLGNTCYMNSVLQCIINTPYLKEYMTNITVLDPLKNNILKTFSENSLNITEAINTLEQTLTYHTYKIISSSWKSKSKYLQPINFKNIFSQKMVSFQNFEQQDSQEALLCILDTIHTELAESKMIELNFCSSEYIELFKQFDQQNISDIDCCALDSIHPNIWELYSVHKALQTYNAKSYSIITEIFQNMISSTLQCPICNFHTYNFDPCLIISLPIPEPTIDMNLINQKMQTFKHLCETQQKMIENHFIGQQISESKQKFTLNDCFQIMNNVEQLDEINMWKCPHCDIKVSAYKQLSIWIPSKIMIIQLKRFISNFSSNGVYTDKKINYMVEYPIMGLNINPFMSEYSRQYAQFTYDLYAVSNHIGQLKGGHYFSFVKSMSNNTWYCLDDSVFQTMSEDDVITPNAYMLFYRLRE